MRPRPETRLFILSIIILSGLLGAMVPAAMSQTANESVALQRGYRTGYSDGYMAGYRDTIDSLAKNYTRHADYTKADRAYNPDYGTIGEYKDGYQQGFESGYNTGFERKTFDQELPSELKPRASAGTSNNQNVPVETIANGSTPAAGTTDAVAVQNNATAGSTYSNTSYTPDTTVGTGGTSPYPQYNGATILIPRDTELILELQDDLSTERSRTGDKFSAKVVSPSEIAGATVEGRVAKITAPGRIRRRSELSLNFDRILLNDNRWANFSGILIEVMPIKGDNVSRVDNEGTAVGRSSLKSDAIKVGGATGAGLVTGAIIAGPVGAGVGAAIGASFGVGAVVIERGKHIKLNRNQQVRIKTAYETQIR